MEREELKEYLREMFSNDPEVARVEELAKAMRQGANVEVSPAEVTAVCEELVVEGVLQNAGRIAYEATEEMMQEYGHEVPK